MAWRQWIICGAALLTAIGHSALDIKNCSSGERNIIEYTTVRVTCGQCNTVIAWYVGDGKDKIRNYVGNCTETDCSVQDKFAFYLNASKTDENFESILSILNNPRIKALVVSCKCVGSSNDDRNSASCKLLIKVPISIVPGSCSVDLSGSKVYGVCTIQWLVANSNSHRHTFLCNWRLTYKSKSQDISYLKEPSTSTTHGPYKRRNCSFMVDMPVDEGDYTYSIRVSSHPADHFSKTLYIGNTQTYRTGLAYGIAAAAVIMAVIGTVIVVSVVKRRRDNKNRKTQAPSVRYAATSGDLYTIVGTATEDDGADESVPLPGTIENNIPGAARGNVSQACTEAEQANGRKQSLQWTNTSGGVYKKLNNVSAPGNSYMNVTEMPNGSGLGVCEGHLKPGFGDTEPDTRVNFTAVNSEDEYNILHFQVDSSGQHDNNYSHLDLK